ncbi:hypothetical protein B5S28_g2958 [[Candida] boidinii]|nr:hypothetical protein B5S28_g2958 [[Candida] boidinii]OWB60771.1 hypothetical protein B5S29_g1652 [[Candida] boidinii]OWB73948.1 hypothetical protein B5S31_g3716 [[Candida] boidinii]OWB79835.1 hypothetical protein B5S32_g4074 [[Candida] boidinii]
MALINLPGRTSSSTASMENKGGINDVNVEEIGSIEVTDSGEEEYTVQRGLKSRHIQLIALGGAIGTGLFVGSGAALASAGPAGILTAYLIISFFVWTIMNQLGEMITYIPQAGKSTMYALCERYTGSKSLAFAAGLNLFYAQALIAPAEITAAAFVIQYWSDLNVAIWISIFWVSIVGLNFLAVKFFGEVEFWIASIKILCIIGLIIVGIVIFFGGAPDSHGVLGFHYWKHPGAFALHLDSSHVNTARFLDVITGIIKSAFAFILSPELVTCCAAESKSPRINLPKATDRFIYRLIFFYICGVLVIGVIVAYNDPRLMNAIANGKSGAAASPFVIGIQNAGIKVLNHIVNACILTSAYSSGNSFIYASSRTLHSMAVTGQVPKIFAKCNKYGVPYISVAFTSAISLISYLNVSSSSSEVFTWLSNISTVSGFISWVIISFTYIRFRKAIDYHGMNDRIPYRPPLQVIGAWSSMIFFVIISLVNGYAVFFNWNTADFFAAYITIPIFFVLLFGHMLWKRKFLFCLPSEQIDVITGLDDAEKEEAEHEAPVPRNFIEKIWLFIV